MYVLYSIYADNINYRLLLCLQLHRTRKQSYHIVFPRSHTYQLPPTCKRKFHNNKIAFDAMKNKGVY